MSHPLIAPVVRRFLELRESVESRSRSFPKQRPAFAAHLELAADRAEIQVLARLPQVVEFLATERQRNESAF